MANINLGQVLHTEGNEPLSTTSKKLNVRAAELEPYVDGLEGKLDSLNGKDFATQTTLASVLAAVDGLESKVDALNTVLGQIKSVMDREVYVLSTDTKPTMAADYRGVLYETDTGKIYYWSGSTWVVRL